MNRVSRVRGIAKVQVTRLAFLVNSKGLGAALESGTAALVPGHGVETHGCLLFEILDLKLVLVGQEGAHDVLKRAILESGGVPPGSVVVPVLILDGSRVGQQREANSHLVDFLVVLERNFLALCKA